MSLYDIYKDKLIRKPIRWGLIASLSLFVMYTLILALANSLDHALQQFVLLWYWMTPLIIGFGVQVGLFVYARAYAKVRAKGTITGSAVATAGGVSAASMIACCVHHLTDVIPLLGFTVAAMFLARYQAIFLALGVVSNLIGIVIMFGMIQKHNLYDQKSILGFIMQINMKKALYVVIMCGVAIIIAVLINSW